MDFLITFISLLVGVIIGCFLMKRWVESDLREQAQETADSINAINYRLENYSTGFIMIVTQLAAMSAKAQATFAYAYVDTIKDDYSLLTTLHKYTTNALSGRSLERGRLKEDKE